MAPAAPGLLRLLEQNFSYPLKFLLDADIAIVHAQRIRDRQDDSDRLPLSMDNSESCERRRSVSKCIPEWDEKVPFLATARLMHMLTCTLRRVRVG